MHEQKVYALLGFAQRAGALASGNTAVESALRRGAARLLVIACDASEQTAERLSARAKARRVPVVRFGTKAGLGAAVGKAQRAAVAVCARGFAESIVRLLREEN